MSLMYENYISRAVLNTCRDEWLSLRISICRSFVPVNLTNYRQHSDLETAVSVERI